MSRSHWAKSGHVISSNCEEASSEFSMPLSSREFRGKGDDVNGFWKFICLFPLPLPIMTWEGRDKRSVHLSFRWTN